MTQRDAFIGQLEELSYSLLDLYTDSKQAFTDSLIALKNQEVEKATKIIENDSQINEQELKINEEAILLIAKQQPVATDLRLIIAIINISHELERMGDLAVNIARAVKRLKKHVVPAPFIEEVLKMADLALIMLDDSMEAFEKRDSQLAKHASQNDDEIDALYKEYLMSVTSAVQVEHLEIYTEYAFIARHIERFGDHATNIAEQVVYIVRGKYFDLNE